MREHKLRGCWRVDFGHPTGRDILSIAADRRLSLFHCDINKRRHCSHTEALFSNSDEDEVRGAEEEEEARLPQNLSLFSSSTLSSNKIQVSYKNDSKSEEKVFVSISFCKILSHVHVHVSFC